MSALAFLSLRPAPGDDFRPVARSPLRRALAATPAGVVLTDLSLELAKFEVRGDLDALGAGEPIPFAPRRALVVAPAADAERVEAALRERAESVLDRSGAFAALRIEAPAATTLLRRLTDLAPERLPAVGAVARVRTIVRRAGAGFELFFPQEYGHYLAEVVVDTARGLHT